MNLKLKLTREKLNEYKNNLKLTQEQKDILIGGLLGDLNLRKIGKYSRLVVEQKNKEYLFHLYEIFKNFIRTEPKERLQKRLTTSEWKSTWYFSSISYLEFEYYYQMFYKDGRKIVPLDIQDILTPRFLAYWFMDDGTYNQSYYRISTCSFTYLEHQLLLDIFLNKWNIRAKIINNRKYLEIYFPAGENKKFKFLVKWFYYRFYEIQIIID